ncbi:MAG: Rpn family recombination-promoting nuclease/putative transposase [Bacteroidia bacterium]|nr:Rpn family recombination-promoting nuclease/putative transposase [Bacteroidia bacterium]
MSNQYIRFDWAAKTVLRDKANFCVFEGLISVLLNEEVHIEELLESESNQKYEFDKFNRVDIKARNSKGEIIIVEIQQTRELYFLERILYGVAKTITEHIDLGEKYNQVKKVYSINILYFDLGKGSDYIYHGQTNFVGLNTNDTLQITNVEKDAIRMKTPKEVFPEYFLIRVKAFDKIPENHIEEWMQYLKNGVIDEDTTAPGLREAKRRLEYLAMTKAERQAYDKHIDNIMVQNDVIDTAQLEGHAEGYVKGRAEGLAEGRVEGKAEGIAEGMAKRETEIASNLKKMGMPATQIMLVTGLPEKEITELQ